jgi:Cu+-exporting ATPase
LDGKVFCCLGCQTVFSLLRESGLDQFYQLQAAPGIRVRSASVVARWKFLDDPAVQETLLDYADGKQSRVTLRLPAIHCVACVWLLENLFKLHPGIGKSRVNFARREAAIAFAPEKIKLSELAALLASIGYEPQFTMGETKTKPSPLRKKAWLQIGLAGFGFGNIMLMSLPFYFGLDSANGPWFRNMAGWLSLTMALPVVTFSASDFWRSAWAGLRRRALTLEVPIAFGLAAVYASSVVEVAAHRGPGYCDSLTGLIFFLLCGRLFQRKTYERLAFDRDYKGFFPLSVVRKITPAPVGSQSEKSTSGGFFSLSSGERAGVRAGLFQARNEPLINPVQGEECIAISRLQTGDRIVLRNGELLPADARLISSAACIDYSFVTGEADPVECRAGAHLYAGGRQVGGAIEVETVKPVAHSYLASLWNNEAFRKTRDNDLESLTNRYSRWFTKVVIGVALAAAAFWLFRNPSKSLQSFTSVLIVACPCALALAAPLTYGTVQRLLARLKIFLRNALVIERMAEINTIVLDKTGTLTTADARGVQFEGNELSDDEREWISSLARHSTHPNSLRISRALGAATLPVHEFEETPGCGIQGEIAGNRILLGSQGWVEGMSDPSDTTGRDGSPPAGTVFVSINGTIRGSFLLQNSVRPEVGKLIASLGGRYELALLSGDNEREAARFEALFGPCAVLKFNQSPADKLRFIQELQQRGRKVMMVGDGLNDAGALRQADVGVAVVEDVGAFSPASDVILHATEVPRLAKVLDFAGAAVRIVRAGFVVSALYNLFGVSIAAAGLLQPMVCAVLMPVSSISVVLFSCGAATWRARQMGLISKTSAPLPPDPLPAKGGPGLPSVHLIVGTGAAANP